MLFLIRLITAIILFIILFLIFYFFTSFVVGGIVGASNPGNVQQAVELVVDENIGIIGIISFILSGAISFFLTFWGQLPWCKKKN